MRSSTANLFDAGLRASSLEAYCGEEWIRPLFLQGDSLAVPKTLPSAWMDSCMTSPPYWGHRQYQAAGIGLEENFQDYISNLCIILLERTRVLKARSEERR